ncbi:hypothetical protein [Candidatus Methylopumilus planktonicus]|uniref:hypothetical protein n=1 Tax=Candidatus Methylopumilus planktonicus TaxID=1581557 RepID=UPI003BEEEAD4
MKKEFIFYIPEYVANSNGIKILYEAAYLFSLQNKVTILTFNNHYFNGARNLEFEPIPKKYISLIRQYADSMSIDNIIFVYPESLIKDPFYLIGDKKIVRYFLAKPYILDNSRLDFSNDFCISYSNLISKDMPNYFLLDSSLKDLLEIKNLKKTSHKKVILYFGKIRASKKIISDKVNLLITLFDEIKIITRTEPHEKNELIAELSSSHLLICFDPITSIIHESILLGTACLLTDDIFKSEYRNFNIPLDGIYFESNLDLIIKKIKSNKQVRINRKKNIDSCYKAIENNQKETERIIKLINKHFSSLNEKKNRNINIKYERSFLNFFLKKWRDTSILNVLSKKYLLYYFIAHGNPYLFEKIVIFYRDIKSKRYFQSLQIFKFNFLNIKLNFNNLIYIYFFVFYFLKAKLLNKSFLDDRDVIELLRKAN